MMTGYSDGKVHIIDVARCDLFQLPVLVERIHAHVLAQVNQIEHGGTVTRVRMRRGVKHGVVEVLHRILVLDRINVVPRFLSVIAVPVKQPLKRVYYGFAKVKAVFGGCICAVHCNGIHRTADVQEHLVAELHLLRARPAGAVVVHGVSVSVPAVYDAQHVVRRRKLPD